MCISRFSNIRILCFKRSLTMNEVFIIGKIINEVKYKFILKKHNNAKAVISLELLDKTKLEVVAYNEIADYAFKNLDENELVFINGKIYREEVVAYNIAVL